MLSVGLSHTMLGFRIKSPQRKFCGHLVSTTTWCATGKKSLNNLVAYLQFLSFWVPCHLTMPGMPTDTISNALSNSETLNVFGKMGGWSREA